MLALYETKKAIMIWIAKSKGLKTAYERCLRSYRKAKEKSSDIKERENCLFWELNITHQLWLELLNHNENCVMSTAEDWWALAQQYEELSVEIKELADLMEKPEG